MGRKPHAAISCENDLGPLMVGGHHEGQSIVLGGMQPGTSYGATELHRELFIAPQGDSPVFEGSHSNQIAYCSASFEPAGLVKRAQTATEEYAITRFGNREGKAWVGHVLDLSLGAEEFGLHALYGASRTANGKDSLPAVDRLRIIRQLLTSQDVPLFEMAGQLGISSFSARNSLKWLDTHGIITYEAADGAELPHQITYTVPQGVEPTEKQGKARSMIHTTLVRVAAQGAIQYTLHELFAELSKDAPEGYYEDEGHRNWAIRVLNELTDEGKITKQGLDGRQRSAARLADTARPVAEKVVAIADGMLEGTMDFINEGKRKLVDILEDEEKVRLLIAKAFRDSPYANRIPVEKRFAYVSEALGSGATLNEVAERVEAEHGMTWISTKATLQQMRRAGVARSEAIPGKRNHLWVPVHQVQADAA